jgi:5'-3' exonuclease
LNKTLIVDGNNLLKIGFHGVKDFFNEGEHVGGIWHFLNTLRKFLEESYFNKVIVFWDGDENSSQRRLLYPKYKGNRKSSYTEDKVYSFNNQKQRVKQYLEEMFVRQLEVEHSEADDLIAYYCQISEDEDKTIFSSDKDLTQLISERVTIYSPQQKQYYKNGDKIKIKEHSIPHYNIKTFKIVAGDTSDNIDGISLLGEKTLVKLFPEILDSQVSFTDILDKGRKLLESQNKSVVLNNLSSGKTKEGILGDKFFTINQILVDLSNPLINEEGKKLVELYYSETLDPDGRGYRNLIKMMMEDGFFKYLPKGDDAWVNFLKPFLKLTRKEKTNYRNKKTNL